MTPYEIRILLHYFISGEDHQHATWASDLAVETFKKFEELGLLERRHDGNGVFLLGRAGELYCKALQAVPTPTQRWVVEWPKEELIAGE